MKIKEVMKKFKKKEGPTGLENSSQTVTVTSLVSSFINSITLKIELAERVKVGVFKF